MQRVTPAMVGDGACHKPQSSFRNRNVRVYAPRPIHEALSTIVARASSLWVVGGLSKKSPIESSTSSCQGFRGDPETFHQPSHDLQHSIHVTYGGVVLKVEPGGLHRSHGSIQRRPNNASRIFCSSGPRRFARPPSRYLST